MSIVVKKPTENRSDDQRVQDGRAFVKLGRMRGHGTIHSEATEHIHSEARNTLTQRPRRRRRALTQRARAWRVRYTTPPDSENIMISAAPMNETSSADSSGSPRRVT